MVGDQDRALVILKYVGLKSIGVDEHRYLFEPPDVPNAFVVQEIGNREITVNIRAESYDSGAEALEVLDLIKTKIRSEAAKAALNALRLAFVWAEKSLQQDYIVDNREVCAAFCDFTLAGIAAYYSSQTDQGPESPGGDWIATINDTGTIPGSLAP
jgi:hypothetical protein